jgi:hypothetical protein
MKDISLELPGHNIAVFHHQSVKFLGAKTPESWFSPLDSANLSQISRIYRSYFPFSLRRNVQCFCREVLAVHPFFLSSPIGMHALPFN